MAEVETLGGNAAGRLKSFFERLNRLEDEADTLKDDKKSVYAELKGEGYTPAVIRKIVSLSRKDQAKLKEANEIQRLYEHALGLDLV